MPGYFSHSRYSDNQDSPARTRSEPPGTIILAALVSGRYSCGCGVRVLYGADVQDQATGCVAVSLHERDSGSQAAGAFFLIHNTRLRTGDSGQSRLSCQLRRSV